MQSILPAANKYYKVSVSGNNFFSGKTERKEAKPRFASFRFPKNALSENLEALPYPKSNSVFNYSQVYTQSAGAP